MEISHPFIRLPYSFDACQMAREIAEIDPAAWMQHPSRLTGNSAVALVSRDAGDNDYFEGAMSITPHLRKCPYLQQVLASFGEVLGRSRLMKLAAGSEVATHVDFNYHWYTRVRIHIPIVTNPQVTFFCADDAVHMRAGECWIFNSWRRHRVTNESNEDRVHLVLDTAGSSRFWETVRQMETLTPGKNRTLDSSEISPVDYDESLEPEIRTEQFNIAPVMSPGELDALVLDLVRDFQSNSSNDPELVEKYRTMLFAFAKDWREVWHLHGYRHEGQVHYEKLINDVYDKLHPDRRALTTCSNDLGVNPVIVQRILRAALAVDAMDHFIGRS
jgi:hypothetical protein